MVPITMFRHQLVHYDLLFTFYCCSDAVVRTLNIDPILLLSSASDIKPSSQMKAELGFSLEMQRELVKEDR